MSLASNGGNSGNSGNNGERVRWLTTEQITLLYNIRARTVRYYCAKYKIARMRIGGGLKIRRDAWEAFMARMVIDGEGG
jgi:hypothetical protein